MRALRLLQVKGLYMPKEQRDQFITTPEQETAEPAPDRFRIRWHTVLANGLGYLVRALTDAPAASPASLIEAWLAPQAIPDDDRDRLASMIVSDLHLLHDGNYARARVTRAEFERWQQVWPPS